ERQRDLKFVPAMELDLVFHGNVKTEDGGARFQRKQHRALFCDIPWSSGSIDGKCRVATISDLPGHFSEGSKAATRAGTSGRTITEVLNALGDNLAVAVHTGHDNDAAAAPIIGGREDTAVPKGENRAISGFIDVVQMRIA